MRAAVLRRVHVALDELVALEIDRQQHEDGQHPQPQDGSGPEQHGRKQRRGFFRFSRGR